MFNWILKQQDGGNHHYSTLTLKSGDNHYEIYFSCAWLICDKKYRPESYRIHQRMSGVVYLEN